MERETFEDAAIAKVLNARFVCIKVDREERPDVDAVYMAALQSFSGSGGWPMSLFLFPDGRPFFAATYLPPHDREGNPGFDTLLEKIHEAWRDHRAELDRDADTLTEAVRTSSRAAAEKDRVPLTRSLLDAGQAALAEDFDPDFGGFGFDPDRPRRPKFPEPSNLEFLLRRASLPASKRLGLLKGPDPRAMVLATLDHMARGGIRDHLGGGYHRYSVDRSWTVPHFEKMLYDNAQLATVFLETFEATKDERWKAEAQGIFAFLDRVMTAPEGGFFSALDAETEGEEGAYYVWKNEEVARALGDGDDLRAFSKVYGLDRPANFEGDRHVLRESFSRKDAAEALGTTPEALEARLAPLRAKLLAVREARPAPRKDEKVLTAWNGLAIAAYADGFRVLKDPRCRKSAEKAADFVLKVHRDGDGRLLRTSRDGKAKGAAYLEDYAFLAHGLIRLHAATGDANRLAQARELTDRMLAEFSDKDGGFFFTADGHETLLARMKDPFDGALPGANSVAIRNLVAMAELTGEAKYLDAAGKALESFSAVMKRAPTGVPLMLVGLNDYLNKRGDGPAKAPGNLAEPGSVLSAEAIGNVAKVAPGDEFDVTIALEIAPGWHISANPSGSETLKPTTVTIAPGSPLTIVKVTYPEGKTFRAPGTDESAKVYEGRATIRARVRLDDKADAGPLEAEIVLKYQPCNDRACLAPATLNVAVNFKKD